MSLKLTLDMKWRNMIRSEAKLVGGGRGRKVRKMPRYYGTARSKSSSEQSALSHVLALRDLLFEFLCRFERPYSLLTARERARWRALKAHLAALHKAYPMISGHDDLELERWLELDDEIGENSEIPTGSP